MSNVTQKTLILLFLFLTSSPIVAQENKPAQKNWKHMKSIQKCQMCHVGESKEKLRMLTGETIETKRSPELCAQCHGIVMRKWESGTHGKKMETWKKEGRKLFCVECHNPHSPKFPLMKAKPAPPRPRLGIQKEKENGRE